MSTKKRPRQSDAAEREQAVDNRADCPFSVEIVDPKEKSKKNVKRRRTGGGSSGGGDDDAKLQASPFAPSGSFKTHETMDIYYRVHPAKKWTDMTRYNSFVLNNTKYFSEGFIFVANDASMERQKAALANAEGKQTAGPVHFERSTNDWVARILEIRASDEHHVFARVFWMYWPEELPKGTKDGSKVVKGKQRYHGSRELVASNHMDIINVVSVTAKAEVNHLVEEDDSEVQENLYWRQALDVRTMELSSIMPVCKCNKPANPDEVLIGCTTEPCLKWMHKGCIKHEALLRVFKELGPNKPHVSAESTDKAEAKAEEDEVQRPLSPAETGPAGLAQDSIGVNSNVKADAIEAGKKSDKAAAGEAESATTPVPSSARGKGKKADVANGESGAAPSGDKPYDGLFDVEIVLDPKPLLQFSDLRKGVKGGDKEWSEPMSCLCCGSQVV